MLQKIVWHLMIFVYSFTKYSFNSLGLSDSYIHQQSKQAITDSDNGLSPYWYQAITWTNAGLISTGHKQQNIQWNSVNIFIHENVLENSVCQFTKFTDWMILLFQQETPCIIYMQIYPILLLTNVQNHFTFYWSLVINKHLGLPDLTTTIWKEMSL